MLDNHEILCCGPDGPNRDGHISALGRRLVGRAARAGAASTAAALLLLAPTMDSPGASTLDLTTEPRPRPRPPPLTAPVAMLVSYRLAATRCHPKQTTSCYHCDFLLPTPIGPHS
jgi:LmbE family N-acetylglucosaminyl deacetylase